MCHDIRAFLGRLELEGYEWSGLFRQVGAGRVLMDEHEGKMVALGEEGRPDSVKVSVSQSM
jgi:hypothetical protein